MKSLLHYRYVALKFTKTTVRGSVLLGILVVRAFRERCRPGPSRADCDFAAQEAKIDEGLKETFPASDPPSHSAPSI